MNDMSNLSGFALTPDQEEILSTADGFAKEEFWPLQQRMDNEEWWPDTAMLSLAKMGFLGVTVPTQLGGAGSDFMTSALITQGLSRWNHSLALSYVAHENLCLNNIARNASEELKQKFLPGMCDGSLIGALGLTEPGASSIQ
jgi:isovaleryl-CoA dehydrogenase